MEISFQLSIINTNSFGYILYIEDIENRLYYNLTYSNENDTLSFLRLSIESKAILLSIPLDKRELGKMKWYEMNILFDSKKDSILLQFNQNSYGVQAEITKQEIRPDIYFGKHGSFIDVPKFAIKNLVIRGKQKKFSFLFNEINGNIVHESAGTPMGKVENPVWLINEAYNWKLRYTFKSNQVAAVNYDKHSQEFLIINADSLIRFNIMKDSGRVILLPNKVPVPMRLGTSFIDHDKMRLFIYEVNDVELSMPSVAALNLETIEWEIYTDNQLPEQRHHHVSSFNKKEESYLIFGGFGNKKYFNEFVTFDLTKREWIIESFSGDFIPPRFFSGLTRYNENDFILFGGAGNPSGDQTIGKIYYTDCYLFNTKSKTIKKLWELDDFEIRMVSGRNMVLSPDSTSFYTLYYKEYIADTYLNLYRFSIKNGEYDILGDSIPMVSERIRTNATLYLNAYSNELYCVTQEFKLDGSSRINIYSITYPPVSKKDFFYFADVTPDRSSRMLFIILATIALTIIVFFVILFGKKRDKKKTHVNLIQEEIDRVPEIQQPTRNAIYLFGVFTVYDLNGREISHLFSPKIKQLFLILFLNSDAHGVTSPEIYQAIWPDKPFDKAKNSKGVTMNQLRKILPDIEGIEYVIENKQHYFRFTAEFYSDFHIFQNLVHELGDNQKDRSMIVDQLITIVSRGKFLESTEVECFDKFKNSIESELLKIIPFQLENCYKKHDYVNVVKIAKILYKIDLTNQLAFHYEMLAYTRLGLDLRARKRYNAFIVDYKNEYQDDYPHTFRELLKHKSEEFIKRNIFA